MPLNRPALSLGAGPRGVTAARQWVVATCRDIRRPELAECAELGVSELVSNALMHARPPIYVRVRGTVDHPRVEVHDGSRTLPMPPDDHGGYDPLLTFGRGLRIVARSSEAWGADVDEDGKTVWFAPARRLGEDDSPCLLTGEGADAAEVPDDPVHVTVREVPLDLYVEFQRHFRELRREVRLLALAREDDYPLACDLAELFGVLDHELRDGIAPNRLEDAHASADGHTDAALVTSRGRTQQMARLVELLDRADDFCRQGRLLSLARGEAQRTFQRWYLGEFVRQGRGEAPLSWHDVAGPEAPDSRSGVR